MVIEWPLDLPVTPPHLNITEIEEGLFEIDQDLPLLSHSVYPDVSVPRAEVP